MKAATYARVSTEEQVNTGTSLEAQQDKTREHVEAMGWSLTDEHVYVDYGVSGAKESRPALDQLMRACECGEVDVIVATKHDRFARSLLNALLFMRDLDKIGVTIEFTDEPNESGLIRNLRFAIAEDERLRIAERTTQGRRAKAEKGVWVGGRPPFGFKVEQRVLVHDDDQALTLRRAHALVTANLSLHEVADTLNLEGRLPRQENARIRHSEPLLWDAQKLRYALTREPLIGRYVYGKSSTVQIESACPAIFTSAEWERLQAVLDASRKKVFRGKKIFPLSGRLVSPCGDLYSGAYDAYLDRRYYRCRGKERSPVCSCKRIRAKDVEDQVFEEVLAFLSDPQRLLNVTGLDKEETHESHRDQVRKLDARISNLSHAITNKAADALEAGLNPTLIAAAVEKLERDRGGLIERRVRIAERDELKRETAGRRARLSLLTRASLSLVNSSLEQQRTIFTLLDVQATMTEDGPEIAGVLREDLPQILGVDVTNVE